MSDPANTAVLRTLGLRKHYGHGAGLVRAVDGVGVDVDVGAGGTVAVRSSTPTVFARRCGQWGATPQRSRSTNPS